MILSFIQSLILVYTLLLSLRILLTWFHGPSYGRPFEILASLTDPYLRIFRRFGIFRFGAVDFSPIAGFLLLGIVSHILSRIQLYGNITTGIILAIIVESVVMSILGILSLLLVIVILRLGMLLLSGRAASPFVHVLDTLLNPLLQFLQIRILKGRIITFQNALILTGASLLVIIIAGYQLVHLLKSALEALPF